MKGSRGRMIEPISREEILSLEVLPEKESFPNEWQYMLTDYVYGLDTKVTAKLLKLGCDPCVDMYAQYATSNHGFLHNLVHEFYNQHTLKGKAILEMVSVLLEHGADANQPGDCNITPIQICNSKLSGPLRELLIRYGARPEGNPRV